MLHPHLADHEHSRPAAPDGPPWLVPDVRGRLDRIARTAAELLGLPIASVSLVDRGRQVPASVVGGPTRSVEGELHWLAEVVAATGPLEVSDLDLDPRFAGRPRAADGTRLRSYLGTPVLDEGGHVFGTIGVADLCPRELSSVQRESLAAWSAWIRAELGRADSATLAVERMKDEFLATVSHELRTPLTSVKGALSLALAGVLGDIDDEVRTVLEVGLENTDRLVRLVNDILDLERLRGGHLPLTPIDTDAAALVAAAVDAVRARADAAGVSIDVAVEPAALFVDATRTVQVVGHLIGNAIKYSPADGVVTVSTAASAEGVVIVVTDQGPGIPPGAGERIFERFAHADATDRREQPGSGLGLPLARGLAEQQGGWLEVVSDPGRGASFRLTLPPPVRSKVDL